MEVEELAKDLHNFYEERAKVNNWNTQNNCKVIFEELPDANKQTMLDLASYILNKFDSKLQEAEKRVEELERKLSFIKGRFDYKRYDAIEEIETRNSENPRNYIWVKGVSFESIKHLSDENIRFVPYCKENDQLQQRVKELEKFIKTVAQYHKLINGGTTYQSLVINLSKKADNLLTPKNQ